MWCQASAWMCSRAWSPSNTRLRCWWSRNPGSLSPILHVPSVRLLVYPAHFPALKNHSNLLQSLHMLSEVTEERAPRIAAMCGRAAHASVYLVNLLSLVLNIV